LPVFSSAVSATSRLKAPLIEPSARPIADEAAAAGKLTAVAASLRRAAVRTRVDRALRAADAAAERPVVREGEAGRVADLRVRAAVEAPLDPDGAREVARRLHDARFDFDLRLRLVERRDQRLRGLQVVFEIRDDERVGARVHLDSCRAPRAPSS
jgi:hypothetical protein